MGTKDKIQSFTDLNAWKEAHKFVLMIYKMTKNFPKGEIFALVVQIRRAAISIVSNIAEGFSRRTLADKKQFYFTALGSLTEVQSQLLVARDLGYVAGEDFALLAKQSVIVSKLLNGLIKSSLSLNA
jgi:four helix bundle protein